VLAILAGRNQTLGKRAVASRSGPRFPDCRSGSGKPLAAGSFEWCPGEYSSSSDC